MGGSQPELTVLNVNVPAVAPDQIRGTRWAKIDEFGHFNMASQSDGGTILDFGARDRSTGTDPDSDTACASAATSPYPCCPH